ncbi:MAG: hypothetical protein A3H96_00660 [Acidobacteria bacterium RIFCSPLOWO2_02_FULL_67_36]|nr:MAG: hypothetical protein A3H96_00660 [Acidobacteria bacterium RIFCSPLOWO2_02_FULL_67_36]OFW23074.1 MAG: hypothetical protein A3G21_00690 [Acidobacteria bacterium RIFCSPLOWO2_12_FULL_66_21]
MLLIPARNASSWTGPTGNNTYLLTGRVPALVDAGVGNPDHIEEIASALNGAPLATVLITHGHSDHVSGLPALMERWPALTVVRTLDAGPIAAGDRELEPIATPGHSRDHLSFLDEASGDLFCGDLLRANGTIVIPASRGGSLRQYLDSLRRIRHLNPRRLLPGHGPIVDDPPRVIDRYLHHREERERQVIESLRAGATTPAEIVAGVYGRLPPVLVGAAGESVLAHLIKLEEEGRARRVDDRWETVET